VTQSRTPTLLLLPGDGIGQEVCAEVRRIVDRLAQSHGLRLDLEEAAFGGASLDLHGVPLTPEVLQVASKADAVLLGAVGAPKWNGVARHLRPEAGLLNLRKHLGVYANLRPATCFDSLVGASSLKPELVRGLDILFVRELLGGVYFGEPRGIDSLSDGQERGYDTQVYTTFEIERVARTAFTLAASRQNSLTSVDKANVMESGVLWRRVVTDVHRREFPAVQLQHMYADNAAMQLVRNPRQFDVLLTDNLFGDVLSDLAGMLTGSLGMLPSAALGVPGSPGLYEPIHGSAPDIAGQGIANPLGTILSLELALRLSLHAEDAADRLRSAVYRALERGARTHDLGGTLSTTQMGDAVLQEL
jgi:3-isopropylmalate dehydrogenase